eukprot:TCONS_00070967-protein
MNSKICLANGDSSRDEFCECENCFRANGGTFVYGSDDIIQQIENQNRNSGGDERPQKEKWTESDIRELISLWGSKDILVNPKHASYYNTRERTKAIEEIKNDLSERGILFTVKQVNDKMINLRTYYGSQRRQIEASKRNAAGPEDIFVSRWKFFDSLRFLSDTIISRSTLDLSRVDSGSENGSTLSPTGVELSSAKTPYQRKRKCLNSLSDYKESTPNPFMSEHTHHQNISPECVRDSESVREKAENSHKSQDEVFGELITSMMRDIPESHEKALMKLEIQHKIITMQYKITSPSSKKFCK